MIATTEFRDAAAAQLRSLGFEPAIVWVPHPVQNRTADELRQMAKDTVAQLIEVLSPAD